MSSNKPELIDLLAGISDGARLEAYGSAEFNAAAQHVLNLVEDACAAYVRGSFGTATFLAITAIEETAKAELMGFRLKPGEDGKPRKDPLRSHWKKHALAVRETVFMGQRLIQAVGAARCAEIQRDAAGGRLRHLREAALYVEFKGKELLTPEVVITAEIARDILLVAIEAADDILVGYTNASYDLGKRLDILFGEVAVPIG